MTLQAIRLGERQVSEFCRRHRVSKLSMFGSILTDRFSPSSDVDFLIELLRDRRFSLIYPGGMLMELRQLQGREVDLRTPGDLSPYFRDEVVGAASVIYAA